MPDLCKHLERNFKQPVAIVTHHNPIQSRFQADSMLLTKITNCRLIQPVKCQLQTVEFQRSKMIHAGHTIRTNSRTRMD